MLSVGSLFAGIGGFDLGFERAGMRTAWQVELDPFCRAVLAHHFPDAERHADVRDVGAHNLAPVDVICGGFPCQDLSLAGKGAGLAGARSGLWSEYARIVGELRPRYVVVENVAALLSRGLGVVLGDLAALGYDAEWDCLPASAFGAPHRRDRIWIVAYAGGEGRRQDACGAHGDETPDAGWGAQDDHVAGSAGPQRLSTGGRATDLADADEERWQWGEGHQSARRPAPIWGEAGNHACQRGSALDAAAGWWSAEPAVGRVAHGVPHRLAQLGALGNALVPFIPQWIGGRIVSYETACASEGRAA